MSASTTDFEDVQANILLPYPGATCARLMFFRFDEEGVPAARDWVRRMAQRVCFHGQVYTAGGQARDVQGPFFNLGFTHQGLEALGFDPFTCAYLPAAFVEGMAERADDLGDGPGILGERGERGEGGGTDGRHVAPVVHALLSVHGCDRQVVEAARPVGERAHRFEAQRAPELDVLRAVVAGCLDRHVVGVRGVRGATHLAELQQDCHTLSAGELNNLEHFGFQDGISQPRIEGAGSYPLGSDSPAGTVLLGHPEPRLPGTGPALPHQVRQQLVLEHLRGGSFLVVRKLQQQVDGLRQGAASMAQDTGLTPAAFSERMMGRHRDGRPLVPHGQGDQNDFDYAGDPAGQACPFQSHARRTNPRDGNQVLRRIMRRAMPYTEGMDRRGLMFMAYNGDLASQFEFVQRHWINGGTESHGLSRDRDPIASEAEGATGGGGGSSSFSLTANGQAHHRSALQHYVQLHWGAYFFVPARHTLRALHQHGDVPLARYAERVKGVDDLAMRRDILGRWLDDPAVCAEIFAQVREAPGGVVRVARAQTVLVGKVESIEEVLADDGGRFSVVQQGRAMAQTTGAFYLGMDPSCAEHAGERRAAESIIGAWHGQQERAAGGVELSAQEQAELAGITARTEALCHVFFGLCVSRARARHKLASDPSVGELDACELAAFVLSGLSPHLFGVPQPSAGGGIAMNAPASGRIFFASPEASYLEYAEQSARGIANYLGELFDGRQRAGRGTEFGDHPDQPGGVPYPQSAVPASMEPDHSWEQKLDQNLEALQRVYRSLQSANDSREDCLRALAGVVSGMLMTSFKLFRDGVQEATRGYAPGQAIAAAAAPEGRVMAAMAEAGRSMPNIIYRTALVETTLAGLVVSEGDVVMACQGSAMVDAPQQQWFFGDRTPAAGQAVRSAHFCPGFRVATAIQHGLSEAFFGLPGLSLGEGEGLPFEFDYRALGAQVYAFQRKMEQARAAGRGQ